MNAVVLIASTRSADRAGQATANPMCWLSIRGGNPLAITDPLGFIVRKRHIDCPYQNPSGRRSPWDCGVAG